MKNKVRKLFGIWDIVIILAVAAVSLCSAAFFLFKNSEDLTLCIRINGEVWQRIDLSSETQRDIDLENGEHHASVHIENGQVCFTFSDCPDKLCVAQGNISRAGESIVCLPGRFSLFIDGSGSKEDKDTESLDAVLH